MPMPPLHPPIALPALPALRRRGFTLVELMISLAVLVLLLAVAVPSMQEFTANNQLVSAKSNFAAALALARTEAAKRGRVVVLQALGTGPTGNEFVNLLPAPVARSKGQQAQPAKLLPDMIAPAWPMRRPGGAVCPAMNPTIGFFTCSLAYAAAFSSASPPISPIITIDLVSGSARNSSSIEMKSVPFTGSPPMPTAVV